MLVTWITLELPELSEDPIDWFPTGTRAISIVEPRYTIKFKVIQQKKLTWNLSTKRRNELRAIQLVGSMP